MNYEIFKGRVPMSLWVRIKSLFRGYVNVTITGRQNWSVETTTTSNSCFINN